MSVPARPASIANAARVLRSGVSAPITEVIAEEMPVALVYNNISHAVMMATPADLEDFGLGFSLSEGILTRRDELLDIATEETDVGIEVRMAIALERFNLLKDRRRSLTGRTGCGICGVESLEQAIRPVEQVTAATEVPIDSIYKALDRSAGAAAREQADPCGPCRRLGELRRRNSDHPRGCRPPQRARQADRRHGLEDVDAAQGFAVITSRCSVEMVQKAAAARIPVLVAISAPTPLAQRMADSAGITLVALARLDSVLVVTHPERITGIPGVSDQ